MSSESKFDRRRFLATMAAGSGTGVLAASPAVQTASGRKIRMGVIGCGSVSTSYLPNMAKSPHIELVSTCDILPERAQAAAKKWGAKEWHPNIDKMLAGAEFEILLNLTPMLEHYPITKKALLAGRHVWCEKPAAQTVAEYSELIETAHRKNVQLWPAPTVVTSPQFKFMYDSMKEGMIGNVCAAHAFYGHEGNFTWAKWYLKKGGGSLYDLGVYNVATLTGLLGPVESVMGYADTRIKERVTMGQMEKVESDDNTMLIMRHRNGILSHVQTGYSYFEGVDHLDGSSADQTINVFGDQGTMSLVGYDWAPKGVDVITKATRQVKRYVKDPGPYSWQWGATYIAECLATDKPIIIRAEHGLHVLEIMNACFESARTERRVKVSSNFKYPVFA
jgi:predicted dehydrogenase